MCGIIVRMLFFIFFSWIMALRGPMAQSLNTSCAQALWHVMTTYKGLQMAMYRSYATAPRENTQSLQTDQNHICTAHLMKEITFLSRKVSHNNFEVIEEVNRHPPETNDGGKSPWGSGVRNPSYQGHHSQLPLPEKEIQSLLFDS